MRLLLLLMGLTIAQCAWAAEAVCHRPGATHSDITRGAKPLAFHADRLLAEDLQAAADMKDALEAIARLQRHLYTMQHPEIQGNFGWYGTVRCGTQSQYQAVVDAISARVAALLAEYVAQRWFIGNTGSSQLSESSANSVTTQRPGLLELLLMSNQYAEFEAQAKYFLRSAKDDSKAHELFNKTATLASNRVRSLQDWDRQLNTQSGQSRVGLLPSERTGIRALAGFQQRIDQLRDEHVEHWLSKEAKSFAELSPVSKSLLSLPIDHISTQQLKNALRVSPEDGVKDLKRLAESRGDALMQTKRFEIAQRYYDLAGNDAKSDIAAKMTRDVATNRAESVKRNALQAVEEIRKTPTQSKKFKDEADDLAAELGIDLDNF